MKNPKSKNNKINIIFSSFLVIGYIICTYFFSSLASSLSGTLGSLIQILMMLLFGLLLFYATRVGEGKQVRRFSLAVLLLIDLPALYIILASLVEALPFHNAIAPQDSTMMMMGVVSGPSVILMLACVALGYGLPYTFFSGYELKEEEDTSADKADDENEEDYLEGGIAEELAEAEVNDADKAENEEKDEEEKDDSEDEDKKEDESEKAEEVTEEKKEEE